MKVRGNVDVLSDGPVQMVYRALHIYDGLIHDFWLKFEM